MESQVTTATESQVTTATVATAPRIMQQILDRASDLNDVATNINARLYELRQRLIGGTPDVEAPTDKAVDPVRSETEQLTHRLVMLENRLIEIKEHIIVLESL